MNEQKQTGPLGARLSKQLGMRFGVRYVVTRDSKNREFQTGDRVLMEPDGSIMCPDAQGWMSPEDVIDATTGWAIAAAVNGAA